MPKRDRLAEIDVRQDPAGGMLLRQKFVRQDLFIPDENVTADNIFQLTDISWPLIPLHQLNGVPRERLRRKAEGPGMLLEEVVHQLRDIFFPCTQWRKI